MMMSSTVIQGGERQEGLFSRGIAINMAALSEEVAALHALGRWWRLRVTNVSETCSGRLRSCGTKKASMASHAGFLIAFSAYLISD
jgi:hypothetical protein